MGHPGNEAFAPLVADAVKRGIVVTSGNSPLTKLQNMYSANGFGYAGSICTRGRQAHRAEDDRVTAG